MYVPDYMIHHVPLQMATKFLCEAEFSNSQSQGSYDKFASLSNFLQDVLSRWEKNRENERLKLLMDQAERIQQGDEWTTVKKHRHRIIERLMFW